MTLILALLLFFLAIGMFARKLDSRTNVLLVVVIAAAIALFYRFG